jgi:chromosome segregation ATPase
MIPPNTQEELATRKADVAHLKQLSGDQKGQIEHLKRSLDAANGQLRETQQALNQMRSDKAHFEREADRLQEEASRVSGEYNKTSKVGGVGGSREWEEGAGCTAGISP